MSCAIGGLTKRAKSIDPRKEFAGGEFVYVDIGAVDQDRKMVTQPKSVPSLEAPSRARQLLVQGDILVSTVRPNLNAVALIGPELDGAVASTGFCVLRPNTGELDGRFLFHWVKSKTFIDDMIQKATGASYPAVSDRIILESQIPCVGFEEQRRIAAILDQAEELRAKRRAAIALLDQLPQAIFLEMFGDPFSNPRSWQLKELRSVTSAIIDCPHSTPVWTSSGVTCLRTSNLAKGSWDWADHRYVSEETYLQRSSRGEIEPGDIVLSREGTVGVMAIVPEGHRMCLGQRLVQVKPRAGMMTPRFLLSYLLFLLSPERLKRSMVGSTAQHLNVKELRTLNCLVPPLELQDRFAARVDAIHRAKADQQSALAELDALFASLQNSAFDGDLN